MRSLAFVLFWVGVFNVVRECVHAKKHSHAITRAEKLYLAMALPLSFGAQVALDLMGVPVAIAGASAVIALGVALNAWAVKRRIQPTTTINDAR